MSEHSTETQLDVAGKPGKSCAQNVTRSRNSAVNSDKNNWRSGWDQPSGLVRSGRCVPDLKMGRGPDLEGLLFPIFPLVSYLLLTLDRLFVVFS
jgi:hypothetical protein